MVVFLCESFNLDLKKDVYLLAISVLDDFKPKLIKIFFASEKKNMTPVLIARRVESLISKDYPTIKNIEVQIKNYNPLTIIDFCQKYHCVEMHVGFSIEKKFLLFLKENEMFLNFLENNSIATIGEIFKQKVITSFNDKINKIKEIKVVNKLKELKEIKARPKFKYVLKEESVHLPFDASNLPISESTFYAVINVTASKVTRNEILTKYRNTIVYYCLYYLNLKMNRVYGLTFSDFQNILKNDCLIIDDQRLLLTSSTISKFKEIERIIMKFFSKRDFLASPLGTNTKDKILSLKNFRKGINADLKEIGQYCMPLKLRSKKITKCFFTIEDFYS